MKRMICLLMALVMTLSLMAGAIISVGAHEADDPYISFNANGGTGTMETVWMNGNYVLPECGFTPPEGYQFKHWKIGNHRPKYPGDTIYVGGQIEAVAIWEPIPPKVVFENGGGTQTMDEVEISGEYTLPACGFTAPEGQQFKCWLVNGAEKQVGDTITVDAVTTVTAVWEEIPEPVINDKDEEPTEQVKTEPAEEEEEDSQDDGDQLPWWVFAIVAVVAIGLGVVVALLVLKKKKGA